MRRRRLAAAALLLAFPGVAAAQLVPTDIDPDTAPERSLGTTATRAGNVTTIDGGTVAGTNLFHSFARFDLAAGDVARWQHGAGDPASITNVVNRVTGGNPSHLMGTLDSTALPNADFFFINPAGIIFGAGVQVNVPAAAHFSTATELRFASGPGFAVTTPGGSTLSVAAPRAFGFLGGEGAILIDGAGDMLPNAGILSLSGSDIAVRDTVLAGSGLAFTATGGANGEVPLDGTGEPLGGSVRIDRSFIQATPGAGTGGIALSAASIALGGSEVATYSTADRPGGDIEVRADSLFLDGGSQISTAGIDGGSGGNIAIAARSVLVTENSLLGARSLGAGAPGSIALVGEDILLTGGSRIVSETLGSGDAQLVILSASRSVTMSGLAWISTDSTGSGNSGAVLIETPLLTMSDSYISADSEGEGHAGGVVLRAGEAHLLRSYVTSDARGVGNGGLVDVEVAGTFSMADASFVTSSAVATGDAGGISIAAGNVLMHASYIESDAHGDGDAGRIAIAAAGRLTLEEASFVSSDSFGAGDAGGVEIRARNADILWESHVSSDAEGNGRGGEIEMDVAEALTLERAFLSTDAAGAGAAGDLIISAGTIEMRSGSFISSDTLTGSTGNAGRVSVTAGALSMTTFSSIGSVSSGDGHGGLVIANVAGALDMENRSNFSSRTYGAGSAGVVSISAGSARIVDSWIDSNAYSTGHAGGVGLHTGELTLVNTEISSEAFGGGNGGTIAISARGDLLLDHSIVVTNSRSSGSAGDIDVEADRLSLVDGSRIASSALPGSTGFSGFVRLTVGELSVRDGSAVSTGSANNEAAGGIVVEAKRLTVEGQGSAIESENSSAEGGSAGTIVLDTGDARIAEGGRLATNSLAGPAGNIFFDMAPGSFLRLTGAGAPGVLETSSGPGTGGLITIASPFAILIDGGSILALGQSGGANVSISTNYFIPSADRLNRVAVDGELVFENAIYDVSAGTVAPDLSLLDASAILRGQCPAVRSGGQLSQLSLRPTGPYGARAVPAPAAAPQPEGCR